MTAERAPATAPPADPGRDAAVLRLTDVVKRYQVGREYVEALAGVSFGVRPGDFLAIMGASGSGKSTLLNILGCLDRPTAGRYWLNGLDVAGMDDDALSDHRLRNLGFVFQSFHLVPQLTVAENIGLPLFYMGLPRGRQEQRIVELATRVGVENRLRHRPAELSGGQRQRVAIARALANDPAVILADEPTGNLDTATSRQIMELLAELNRQGRTILIVTHEEDIAAFARARIYLRDGRIRRIVGEVLP
jgi:putative ABC transport system ATP-binding protein